MYWNSIFKKYYDISLIIQLWIISLAISGRKSKLVYYPTTICVLITLGNYFVSDFSKYVIFFIVFNNFLAIMLYHITKLLRHFFFSGDGLRNCIITYNNSSSIVGPGKIGGIYPNKELFAALRGGKSL